MPSAHHVLWRSTQVASLVLVLSAACGGGCGGGTEPSTPDRIDVSPTNLSLTVGETAFLNATVKDCDGRSLALHIDWSSSNGVVASVNSSGVVTAVGPGETTVRASSQGLQKNISVVVRGNQPPTAAFIPSCTGLTCNFIDESTDSDGTVVDWSWEFDDGGTSTAQNPTHSYDSGGTYTVTLTVTDNDDDTDSHSEPVTVTVEPTSPTAGFSAACPDLTCTFTDQSTDSDGTVTAWAWDFGDGVTSTAQNPTHPYAAAGTYTVSLTVTDNDGNNDTYTKDVIVTGVPSGNLSGKILFSRHAFGLDHLNCAIWGLFAMADNGSGVTEIVPEDRATGGCSTPGSWLSGSMTPAGSADGEWVAYKFRWLLAWVFTGVRVIKADKTDVYDLGSWDLAMPSFSPDGGRIAAIDETSAVEDQVVVWASDGSGSPTTLFSCALNWCVDLRLSSQAWWPGGEYIVFSYRRLGEDLDRIEAVPVTGGSRSSIKVGGWDPAVSADYWIAWTSDESGDLDIWVAPNGGAPRQLTFNPSADHSPVWSGDGTRLAFVSNRDGNDEIYVINRDGSGLTRLTTNSVADRDPHWVPARP